MAGIASEEVNANQRRALGGDLVNPLSMLDRKLVRDLARLWAQALAVALVMACGVMTLILALGATRALDETRSAFYDRTRFADSVRFGRHARPRASNRPSLPSMACPAAGHPDCQSGDNRH
jgi:hypothetical protein